MGNNMGGYDVKVSEMGLCMSESEYLNQNLLCIRGREGRRGMFCLVAGVS